jgi:hypothetical protein
MGYYDLDFVMTSADIYYKETDHQKQVLRLMTHSMSQRFAPLHSAFWHRIPAGVA